ncbi:hypothetical protein PV516_01285 [Streptomyces scabiei]|uniref:hypothetical protein n=1 Tax=Streptomyces scabiei TaxID=1930 RepID=UPI0029BB16A0|nr:hypothetical protein [Streptomyces scabiei]MDX3162434.1 hypothetical protein [Streptomyces scabiei]
MPRIKVLEAVAGADFSWAPGDVVDVSEEEAASWADGHRAVLVDDQEQGQGHAVPQLREKTPPRVVTSEGLELDVIEVEFAQVPAPDGADDGAEWGQLMVTVALPAEDGLPSVEESGPDDGMKEPPEVQAFNPLEHSNREVLAYLDTVGYEEALRVLDVEANEGQPPRAGIVKNRDKVLEAARARGGDQAGAEKTAEASRGGGRSEQPETRSW